MCWPQFNDMGPGPAHGFARNSLFTVEEQSASRVVLLLSASETTRTHFPHDFELRISVSVSDDRGGELTQTVRSPITFASIDRCHQRAPTQSTVGWSSGACRGMRCLGCFWRHHPGCHIDPAVHLKPGVHP